MPGSPLAISFTRVTFTPFRGSSFLPLLSEIILFWPRPTAGGRVWAQLSSLVAPIVKYTDCDLWMARQSAGLAPSHHSLTRAQDTSTPCFGQQLLNREGAINLVSASDLEVWLWCPSCNNRHQNYPARKLDTRLCVQLWGWAVQLGNEIKTALNYAKMYLNKYFYSRGCLSHKGHFLLLFFMLYWTLPQSERGLYHFMSELLNLEAQMVTIFSPLPMSSTQMGLTGYYSFIWCVLKKGSI